MEQPGEMNPDKDEPKPTEQVNAYARWGGIAFQMMAMIGLGVWGGMWLDKAMELTFPAFTLGLALIAVVGSMYLVYRQAIKAD